MTVPIFIYVFVCFLKIFFRYFSLPAVKLKYNIPFFFFFPLHLAWLLCTNFLISAALCVTMTFDIKQFNCKNVETEKHQTKPPKHTTNPILLCLWIHDNAARTAFAKWVGKLVWKAMSFCGPSLDTMTSFPFSFIPLINRAVGLLLIWSFCSRPALLVDFFSLQIGSIFWNSRPSNKGRWKEKLKSH